MSTTNDHIDVNKPLYRGIGMLNQISLGNNCFDLSPDKTAKPMKNRYIANDIVNYGLLFDVSQLFFQNINQNI